MLLDGLQTATTLHICSGALSTQLLLKLSHPVLELCIGLHQLSIGFHQLFIGALHGPVCHLMLFTPPLPHLTTCAAVTKAAQLLPHIAAAGGCWALQRVVAATSSRTRGINVS